VVNHGVHETCQVCTSGLQYFPSTRLRQSGRRLTDHLGSTVATTDSNGTLTSQQRYLPFGGTRTNVTAPNSPGTDFGYTGQRQLDAGMGGLMDYNARFYSPMLGRFIQPDTVIPDPGGSQGWNRYSYVLNNPISYNDPSGHCAEPITFVLCAAAIGAVVSVAIDAYVTTQVNHESYSWEQAGKAAAGGAVAGAVGATVGLAGAAIAGTSLVATVATGAVAGAISGQASRGSVNVLSGKEFFDDFSWKDVALDAGLGAASSAVAYGLGKYSSSTRFHPSDPEMSAKYPKGVQFDDEGFPNFSEYSEADVKIKMEGNYTSDYTEANRAAGIPEKPDNMTWHHNQDRTTMQLVPRDLHRSVPHKGGVSLIKLLGRLFDD